MVDQPYLVVVVDDDPDVVFHTKTVLEKYGCVGEGASNPLFARETVRRRAPDVVIIDIEMPDLTGLDLIEEIRAERPGIPIMMHKPFEDEAHDGRRLAGAQRVEALEVPVDPRNPGDEFLQQEIDDNRQSEFSLLPRLFSFSYSWSRRC